MYPADGQIAQLVEQGTENPCVSGSIPLLATIFILFVFFTTEPIPFIVCPPPGVIFPLFLLDGYRCLQIVRYVSPTAKHAHHQIYDPQLAFPVADYSMPDRTER